jgi:hypothetical protein
MTDTPEPTVQPTSYVVSSLPEGHDDRFTFTVQVRYHRDGLFSVRHGLKFADRDGIWEYEPSWPEDGGEADAHAEEAWMAAHRFDHDTALRLARELAPTLTYRGRTVADALAWPAV